MISRSGRRIKKPEIYSPEEELIDDYDEDDYDEDDDNSDIDTDDENVRMTVAFALTRRR